MDHEHANFFCFFFQTICVASHGTRCRVNIRIVIVYLRNGSEKLSLLESHLWQQRECTIDAIAEYRGKTILCTHSTQSNIYGIPERKKSSKKLKKKKNNNNNRRIIQFHTQQ